MKKFIETPGLKLIVLLLYVIVVSHAYVKDQAVEDVQAASEVVELVPTPASYQEIHQVSENSAYSIQVITLNSPSENQVEDPLYYKGVTELLESIEYKDTVSGQVVIAILYDPFKIEKVSVSDNEIVSDNEVISENNVVSTNDVTSENKVVPTPTHPVSMNKSKPKPTPTPYVTGSASHNTILVEWDGGVLTKRKGVNQGPSGKETYYSLPMDGVIKMMRAMGNNDEHWIREDGVHMLGDYVMVAANLNLRPRGSYIETSLGMGVVADTGGFAKDNPTQLDIATIW